MSENLSWDKIVFMLAILLIITNILKRPKEGFETRHIEKTNDNLYDKFYAKIYDYLVFSEIRNNYEVGEIINQTQPTEKSVILDIGSGTGNIVNEFKKKGYNITGVDDSQDMINMSKKKYALESLVKGNVMQPHLFPFYHFTHILCLYFTVYYMKNKTLFFENVYDWLKPGGVFILHLVNREKFNPTLPMNTFQRRKPGNITKIPFQDFDYEARFELNKQTNTGYFYEKFKNQGGSRKNVHHFYMEDQKTIIHLAQKIGFIVEGKISMDPIKYDYQYLYILKKPYL